MKDWRDDRPIRFDSPVYISFDLDALDPACAPGVSHREPGGLTTRQAIDLIHRMEGSVVGADIVELNPTQDVSGLTAMVCGRLVKEIAAKMLAVS
jgi:arginase